MAITYEDKFRKILKEQSSISNVGKLIKIDTLSCFEMERELKVLPNTDPTWFFFLSTLLNHEYYKRMPNLPELLNTKELLKPMAVHQAYRRKKEVLLNASHKEFCNKTLCYLDLRKRMLEEIRTSYAVE